MEDKVKRGFFGCRGYFGRFLLCHCMGLYFFNAVYDAFYCQCLIMAQASALLKVRLYLFNSDFLVLAMMNVLHEKQEFFEFHFREVFFVPLPDLPAKFGAHRSTSPLLAHKQTHRHFSNFSKILQVQPINKKITSGNSKVKLPQISCRHYSDWILKPAPPL